MEDESTLAAIHRLVTEAEETRLKIKQRREDLKDILLQNQEWQDIQEEIKALTAKRAQAKKILEADRDYQIVNTDLQELKFKQNDLREIMSHHLVTHYDATHDTVVKDPEGEMRQLLLNAKLGKPEASFDDAPKRPSKKPLPGQVSIESQVHGYGKPGGAK